jgi:hypothetical protein
VRYALVLAVVTVLAWVLVESDFGRKNCHYNSHFAKRLVCTDPTPAPRE